MTVIEESVAIGNWVAAFGEGEYSPRQSRALGLRRDGKIVKCPWPEELCRAMQESLRERLRKTQ